MKKIFKKIKHCKCGCGQLVKKYNRFIRGHNMIIMWKNKEFRDKVIKSQIQRYRNGIFPRKRIERENKYCQCGCGFNKEVIITKEWRYKRGHNARIKHPKWNKGLTKETDRRVRNNSLKIKEVTNTIEFKERKRKQTNELLKNDEWVRNRMSKCKLKPNRLELKFSDLLQGWLPNEYKYVGDGQFILGGKNPDWMNINGKKKLIELFGNFWHSDNNQWYKVKNDEKERISHFKSYGFSTLVIWESELRNVDVLKNKILNFNNSKGE